MPTPTQDTFSLMDTVKMKGEGEGSLNEASTIHHPPSTISSPLPRASNAERERADALRARINHANYQYYALDAPELSDAA